MIWRKVLAATLATLPTTACTLPVSESDIGWRYPMLSKDGCPDLSGAYLSARPEKCSNSADCEKARETSLLGLMTNGIRPPHPISGTTIDWLQGEPRQMMGQGEGEKKQITYSVLRQTRTDITIDAFSDAGLYARATIPLQSERIGCVGGALIIRRLENYAGSEGGSGSVDFSETSFRKLPAGMLEAVKWSAQKGRSRLTGQAQGDVIDQREKQWVFRPASRADR